MQVFWIVLSLLVFVTEGAPPVFNNIRSDDCVGVNENTNRIMQILDVTDPEGDPISCSNQVDSNNGNHVGTEFSLLRNLVTRKYELDVAAGADFTPYDPAMIYWNRVRCSDGFQTSTATVFVKVEDGQDIDWAFGGTTVTVPVDCIGSPAGTTVYTATATATLGYDIAYDLISVTSTPSALPASDFFMVHSATGEIIAVQDLERLSTDIDLVDVTVRATAECLVTYATITLNLTNQYTPPTTTDLPLVQDQLESIPAGTILFTLNIIDPDTQTHTVKKSCNPPIGNRILTLSGNNVVLAAGQSLNFETMNTSLQCTFILNDGLHISPSYQYTLNVLDVNDAPVFGTSKYYVRGDEGLEKDVLGTPGFTCSDEDSANGPEPLSYSIQSSVYSSYFRINASGVVSYAQDYDVDSGSLPMTLTLNVDCTDDEGATDTAELIITINDINDNAPNVPVTVMMYSDQLMTSGKSVVGTLTLTDADVTSPNNLFTCYANSTSLYADYYHVATTCQVVVAKPLDFDIGTTVQYAVYVIDNGSPKLTSFTVIDVVFREVVTTTTTTTTASTTTPYDFGTHPENIALCVLMALFCLPLLALMAFGCIRYCRGRHLCSRGYTWCKDGCCRRRYPERPPTPITPKRAPTPPPRAKIPIIIREPPPPGIMRAVQQPIIVAQPALAPAVRPIGPVGPIQPGPVTLI